MFEATAALGGLDVKLVYYRGFNECKASRWMSSAAELHRAMRSVSCVGGETQIERVLAHALARNQEAAGRRAGLCRRRDGGEVSTGCASLPASSASTACRSSCSTKATPRSRARPSGRWRSCRAAPICASTLASADRLKELLGAVAVYAAGGYRALTAYGEKQRRRGAAPDRAAEG